MALRRSALLRGLAHSVVGILALRRAPGADAQGSATCSEVTVSGLSTAFPAANSVYTNTLAGDDTVRGEYVHEDEEFFIWYAPGEVSEWTADTPAAALSDCAGSWVLSSYPPGDTFTDTEYYEADGVGCETSPEEVSEWLLVDAEGSSSATDVQATCSLSEDEDDGGDDDGGGGLSNRTIVVLLIVVGIGFMVLMCLGALACCIRKGSQGPEENIMPPGELPDEGSVIGGKVGEATKPGLHAHPEIRGAQHPRPEDWAPSYTSTRNGDIPTGSRSGPSVRSIGYS